LEAAETAAQPLETLRFWEPAENMAVVGRSSYVDAEVHQDACRELGIPVFRRISGGAAIVTGPGCLMYAVVLSYQNYPGLSVVKQAHAFVLETLANALSTILPSPFGRGAGGEGPVGAAVHYCGTSDLALDGMKFSGNSMRCRKRHLLYHGTILYNFPLELISRCLKIPPRMPDYRNARDHETFVANLPVPAEDIKRALLSAWNALEPLEVWPRELTARLAAEKYGNPQWNDLL